MTTLFPRCSGILLHPTSLPGKYGIGDLGQTAFDFVDWLAEHGQSVWQVLPLGPTSYGDSPYQTLSAFAGNPNLVSLDKLIADGWLTGDDLADIPDFPEERVDFGPVIKYHDRMLTVAHERFLAQGAAEHQAVEEQQFAFDLWCVANAYWLDDFALFVALKDHHGGKPWVEWPESEALRHEDAIQAAQTTHAGRIAEHRFRQWVFHKQWYELKDYANEKKIRLFGDIPIFVAHDSADVWANRDEYYLDEKGNPIVIAGVPPDYFSPTGQRWGNPLYQWDVMKERGYSWWISRFRATLSVVDYIRIDHFRGFEAYWEIPAEEETAIKGTWIDGPGADLFTVVERELGHLPIIAEDLGVITQGVEELRDGFNLPGMKVLQFAWSDSKNPFLPHNHVPNAVVYTGTHDNNTTVGWWNNEVSDGMRQFMSAYLNQEILEPNWFMIRLAMMSVCHTCIVPMQDVLGLGPRARMNTPGLLGGNWTWRFLADALDELGKEKLAHLTGLYQRRPDQQEKEYGDAAVSGDEEE